MEKNSLTIQQSILIVGLSLFLALMTGIYTDRKDKRCDALIYTLDTQTLQWLATVDPSRTKDFRQNIEQFHGITFRECSIRLK